MREKNNREWWKRKRGEKIDEKESKREYGWEKEREKIAKIDEK